MIIGHYGLFQKPAISIQYINCIQQIASPPPIQGRIEY